jgi:hypothetical protein
MFPTRLMSFYFFQTRLEHESKALLNPINPHNRFALHDNYSIQLPLIEQREAKKVVSSSADRKFPGNKSILLGCSTRAVS